MDFLLLFPYFFSLAPKMRNVLSLENVAGGAVTADGSEEVDDVYTQTLDSPWPG